MLNKQLIQPKSIVIVGGSDNISSPGGRVLKNLIDHDFQGDLLVLNPKKNVVQGIKSYINIDDLPKVELAIIAIASKYILETVHILTQKKNTKAFIIFSAGFSEKDEEGAQLEREIVNLINKADACLLGPNNIGLLNTYYAGVFTAPIPKLDKKGVHLISGSGATAVFIMEASVSIGLSFNSVFSVGNSAQIGVEEVLQYYDENHEKYQASKVILLYIESINNPKKLLKHAVSLAQKGFKIAAIKAGSSDAGSRAATSHTGAMANSDVAVDALFDKAKIIRCYGRNELINVAAILQHKTTKGKRFAIITHAGGPAVMLTDILEKNNLQVPKIESAFAKELLEKLYHGSSVQNPIDFLATGNAEQLELIIDYCEHKFDEIDALIIIFGSPGLTQVYDVYDVIDSYNKINKKPIYAVLPSVVNVKDEIKQFISKGNIGFNDEVLFGKALAKVYANQSKVISKPNSEINLLNKTLISDELSNFKNAYLSPKSALKVMQAAAINCVEELVIIEQNELQQISDYPVVMKVVGPIHKTDVGGVILDVKNIFEAEKSFKKLMQIPSAKAVLIQPMKKGLELFIGAKKEGDFGHLIMCGLGGTYIEIFKDVSVKLAPLTMKNAEEMVKNLKIYPILKGVRGKKGIDIEQFISIILQISKLVTQFPEIEELDINPLIANDTEIMAVDFRLKVI
jgi:acetyltransferase